MRVYARVWMWEGACARARARVRVRIWVSSSTSYMSNTTHNTRNMMHCGKYNNWAHDNYFIHLPHPPSLITTFMKTSWNVRKCEEVLFDVNYPMKFLFLPFLLTRSSSSILYIAFQHFIGISAPSTFIWGLLPHPQLHGVFVV